MFGFHWTHGNWTQNGWISFSWDMLVVNNYHHISYKFGQLWLHKNYPLIKDVSIRNLLSTQFSTDEGKIKIQLLIIVTSLRSTLSSEFCMSWHYSFWCFWKSEQGTISTSTFIGFDSPRTEWVSLALDLFLSHGVRIMTWIRREGWLISDLAVFFSGSVFSPNWIQVSFILIDRVCLRVGEFYGL